MDSMIIWDVITGRRLQIIQQTPNTLFLLLDGDNKPVACRPRSIGKAIRTWMKERRREGGIV